MDVQSLQHGTSLGSGICLRKSRVGCVSVKKSFCHIRVRRFHVENNKTRNVDSYSLYCETSIVFLEMSAVITYSEKFVQHDAVSRSGALENTYNLIVILIIIFILSLKSLLKSYLSLF